MSITGRLARFASSRSNDSRAKAEGSGYLGTPTQSQASDVSNFQEQGAAGLHPPLLRKKDGYDCAGTGGPAPKCPVCNAELALMDLPAQQHHINACLDSSPLRDPSLQDAAPVAPGSRSSSHASIEGWLHSLGLGCYAHNFDAEQVGMDCLALLSDKDLQLLGMTHEHRQLVKDAIANMQMSSRLGAACKSQECKLGGSDCHRLAKEHASDLASGSSTLSNCIVPKAAIKRFKGHGGVILKPPPARSAPGKSKSAPVCRRDSSYSRSAETALLAVLFPISSRLKEPVTAPTAFSEEHSNFRVNSSSARMVDARKSLWRFASSTPKENKDLLATPLPKRIAARKLQRNAQNAVLQELGTMQQNKTNQKIIKENAPQEEAVDKCRSGLKTALPPASMQTLQLQALRTELQAAEGTVAELKRLISELESQ